MGFNMARAPHLHFRVDGYASSIESPKVLKQVRCYYTRSQLPCMASVRVEACLHICAMSGLVRPSLSAVA
jgi:hypothetical protein